MASPGPSGDDLCRAYAQLWSDPLPNGQIVRPLRGFPSAVYFSWAKHFKRMADDEAKERQSLLGRFRVSSTSGIEYKHFRL